MPVFIEALLALLAVAASLAIYFKLIDRKLDAALDKIFKKQDLDEEFGD